MASQCNGLTNVEIKSDGSVAEVLSKKVEVFSRILVLDLKQGLVFRWKAILCITVGSSFCLYEEFCLTNSIENSRKDVMSCPEMSSEVL